MGSLIKGREELINSASRSNNSYNGVQDQKLEKPINNKQKATREKNSTKTLHLLYTDN